MKSLCIIIHRRLGFLALCCQLVRGSSLQPRGIFLEYLVAFSDLTPSCDCYFIDEFQFSECLHDLSSTSTCCGQ